MRKSKNRKSLREVRGDLLGGLEENWQPGIGADDEPQGIIPDFTVALENPFIEPGSDQDNQLAVSHKLLLEKLRKR